MKKRVLSLFMVLVLCLTLLPTAAFAEGEDVSISGGVIGGGETGGEGGGVLVPPGGSTGEGGGIYVAPGSPTEGGRRHIYPRRGHAGGDLVRNETLFNSARL